MRHFLTQGVHTTKNNLGVMIFISEFERYIEIVVDHGVSERISEETWATAVNLAIPFLKQNKAFDALTCIIRDVGQILQDEIPIMEDKQELPNHVIMI